MTERHLSSLYERDLPIAAPHGIHRGHFLAWNEASVSRHPHFRRLERAAFSWTPWGIDFDRRLWFFLAAPLAAGRFEPRVEESRWRETRTVALHYGASRLPEAFRRYLYDEVKPLSERWMLGIGGIDRERGEGDHFFFALERIAR